MNSIELTLYIILVLGIIFITSFFMEIYKKIIRKDNAKKWECWLVGAVFSAVGIELLHLSGALYLVFHNMLGAKEWLDYSLYIIIFYYCQLKVDMKVIKGLILSLSKTLIKKSSLTEEQKKIIISSLEKNDKSSDM